MLIEQWKDALRERDMRQKLIGERMRRIRADLRKLTTPEEIVSSLQFPWSRWELEDPRLQELLRTWEDDDGEQ